MSKTTKLVIYKVVLDTLNKKTESGKTIAEAMIDGTITEKDLMLINSEAAFPANKYNRLKLPEGEYASHEAMASFVEIIGPYLSDYNLYKIIDLLTNIEMVNGSTVYRNSSLAKSFIFYENQRQSAQMPTGSTSLPQTFIAHMRGHVLPLCKELYSDSKKNLTEILRFSLKLDNADQYAEEIINANNLNFSADSLNKTAPKSATDFAIEMENLQKNYKKLTKTPILVKAVDLIDNVSEKLKKQGKESQSSKSKKAETDLNTNSSTSKKFKNGLEQFLLKSDLALNAFNKIDKLTKIPVENIILTLKYHRKDQTFIKAINKENLYIRALMEKDLAKFILTSKQYAKIITPNQAITLLQAHAEDKAFMKAAFPRFNITGRINLEQLARSDIKIFEKIIASTSLLSKLGHKATLEVAQFYSKDNNLRATVTTLFNAIKAGNNNDAIKPIQKNIVNKLKAALGSAKENTKTEEKKIVIGAEIKTLTIPAGAKAGDRVIATDAPGLNLLASLKLK